ncbi:type II secretion system F family protein [Sinimarinibacterium flocculans]|uniref:type II secretion system F family protein n=1 Tax=Sinimarinibacterium flocculans TaxID=985250 RepID=UPI00351696C8
MSTWRYRARAANGDLVRGVAESATAAALADRLLGDGLTPVDIRPRRGIAGLLSGLGGLRPSDEDLIMFARQMASLLRAGVPVSRAVLSVHAITRQPALKRALRRVAQGIAAGQELALAMQQESGAFSRLAVSLVAAGERVGRLDRSFEQLASHMERERETRRAVWKSLRYPAFVVGAMLLALIVINTFAVPAFVALFDRLGTELPLATRLLIALADGSARWGPLLAAAIIAGIAVFRLLPAWHGLRARVDTAVLRTPVLGGITRLCIMARFCRSWAMLLMAGQPIMDAVGVTADIVDNAAMRRRLLGFRQGLRRGQSLSDAATRSGAFDPLVVQMLSVGELSGSTPQLIEEVGRHYEDEARYRALRAADALQPALVILLGVLVALLAAGVFLPMWSVMDGYY